MGQIKNIKLHIVTDIKLAKKQHSVIMVHVAIHFTCWCLLAICISVHSFDVDTLHTVEVLKITNNNNNNNKNSKDDSRSSINDDIEMKVSSKFGFSITFLDKKTLLVGAPTYHS